MADTTTRLKLTKRKIDATGFPKSGERILRDQELPGFTVRSTTSFKSFVVEKRIHGRLHKVKAN